MATFQNEQITVVKDNGLVSHVFADSTLRASAARSCIGHTRYSTSGSANWTAAQPVFRSAGASGFALAHNGNLTNTTALAASIGMEFTSLLSDSDLVAEMLSIEVERRHFARRGAEDGARTGRRRLLDGHPRSSPGARRA